MHLRPARLCQVFPALPATAVSAAFFFGPGLSAGFARGFEPPRLTPLQAIEAAAQPPPASTEPAGDDPRPGHPSPTDEERAAVAAVRARLAARGLQFDTGAYESLPILVLHADLEAIARAADAADLHAKAIFQVWELDPQPAAGETPSPGSIALGAPYFAPARCTGEHPLTIVLLPRAASLREALPAVTDPGSVPRACGLYFPAHREATSYRAAMPAGKPFPPSGRIPPSEIGKVIGRPDDPSFQSAAKGLAASAPRPGPLGSIITTELTPALWAVELHPGAGPEIAGPVWAVPLLDANGAAHGASFTAVDPDRGSAFENLLADAPPGLSWARHSFFRLPRPMTRATRESSDAERARAAPQEMFTALIGSPGAEPPAVQAFRKAPTWRPFSEDVILDPAPSRAHFRGGEIRAIALSASIEPGQLSRVLAAMADADPPGPAPAR